MLYLKTIGLRRKDLDDPEGDGFVGFVHQVVIGKFYQNMMLQRILNYISLRGPP